MTEDDIVNNWLERQTPNTGRAYGRAVRYFRTATGVDPLHATDDDAARWRSDMRDRDLAPATINQYLAALSSLRISIGGGRNPFAEKSLHDSRTPDPVDFPTTGQLMALLAQIDASTITGLRNAALIAGLIATTRRISEWIGLRGSDLADGWFSYRCKGGGIKRQQMPPDIARLIERYLRTAGRWPLPADEYVFISHSNNGQRLGAGHAEHLHPGYVARLIKRYGLAAGIPAARLYPHALRHAGAQFRREQRADIMDIQSVMGHDNTATTLAYLRRIERPVDPQAETIRLLLPPKFRG